MIAVIGGNTCTPGEAGIAREVGQGVAKRGGVVICGGRGGVMQAACQGAEEAGGLTVGILPGDDVRQANPFVHIPIASGMGIARNALIIHTAAVVIAIGGRYGTLSEIAHALQLGKPVFSLGSWCDIPGLRPVGTAAAAVEQAFDYLSAQG
jgi:uncharacterized protein (TIGR00725 family)